MTSVRGPAAKKKTLDWSTSNVCGSTVQVKFPVSGLPATFATQAEDVSEWG